MGLVYANAAGFRGGAFDASLEFGYMIPPREGGEQSPPQWLVRVAMSWEHLRAFHDLVGEQLANYEEAVGVPIRDLEKLRKGEP